MDYKKSDARAKAGIRKIKKNSFQEFCGSLTKHTNPPYIWNTTKRFKNRWNRTEKQREFKPERIQSARALIDDLCPPWDEGP